MIEIVLLFTWNIQSQTYKINTFPWTRAPFGYSCGGDVWHCHGPKFIQSFDIRVFLAQTSLIQSVCLLKVVRSFVHTRRLHLHSFVHLPTLLFKKSKEFLDVDIAPKVCEKMCFLIIYFNHFSNWVEEPQLRLLLSQLGKGAK